METKEKEANSEKTSIKENKVSASEESKKSLLDEDLVTRWSNEQVEMKKRLILYDTLPWQLNRSVFSKDHSDSCLGRDEFLRYVAGLDISFVKDENTACSGLFVFDLADDMKLVYQDLDKDLIQMTLPYVPGFLAYREAPFLLEKLEKLKREKPEFYPQCILIDGNGLLHCNKFGAACHIGLLSDTPTIGVSKKLFQVFGLENSPEHKERIEKELKSAGDYFELRSQDSDNELLGLCYRSTDKSKNPVYVSVGHKISWETCLWVMKHVSGKFRIPEPIRKADLITREFLRNINAPVFSKKGKKMKNTEKIEQDENSD